MEELKVFCPATIANVSCGFDVLGLALAKVGDEMTIKKTREPGITISKIEGQDLPLDTDHNVAGVAAKALLQQLGDSYHGGFDIAIHKKIKPGSGIGSSAASAAGAVAGINQLLDHPFSQTALVRFAMQGEKLASGVAHADNVAPAILGGFTLVRSYEPLDIIKIPTPSLLYATILHPQIEIKTADSRKILKTSITLQSGIKQWGNLGGLIAGLYTNDYELIGRSLEDHIIEPIRSILIPGYDIVKQVALKTGALGVGISGSGPSIFALSKGKETAERVAEKMYDNYDTIGLEFDMHISPIASQGVHLI
ncbi:Homoserine kinase [Croceitalea dokdonensis DOKDO 023]|uniref:Homoserine kinase n=1 Tax=Croceitalea dokdonensis DOKDO 023 TaxID=1300341 RepID=A0A0P7A2A8_9FLAO|nr:homoserine kinase [Croceitalea dokdonensis]KPM30583.1 Homoserine kinase [Croceitalea dokdonensis DOKDO 023]